MTDRRYTEEEIAAIFERATEAQHTGHRALPPGEGMTLADLQEIGLEVGLPAELVAQAAHSLDRPARPEARHFLGLPVGVGRTVELGRRLTEAEWERLVVDLRETFDAKGRVSSEGAFRQWTNGNLQVLLEPAGAGQRVRMRTLHGNARAAMMAGVGLGGVMGAVFGATIVTGSAVSDIGSLATLAALGLALFGSGALRIPGWARRRREQMDAIAARLEQVAGLPPGAIPD